MRAPSQAGALPFLAFIVLYKLGDAFAGSLLTPFLLQAMHYSTAEVGVVNKVIGLWLTIAGALVGGVLGSKVGKKYGGALLDKFNNQSDGAETPGDKKDVTAELERLAKLHKQGILSDDEFRAAKARLLDL